MIIWENEIEKYIRWYNEDRIKTKLNGMSLLCTDYISLKILLIYSVFMGSAHILLIKFLFCCFLLESKFLNFKNYLLDLKDFVL